MDDTYTIQGVGILFGRYGRATEYASPMAAAPRCFCLAGVTRLLFDHLDDRAFASTWDRSLALWQDDTGLFFQAFLPVTRVNAGLTRMIRTGLLRGASVRFADDRQSVVTADGELVLRSSLPELSIVADPAQDGTACWLEEETSAELPAEVRVVRSRWQMSAMARTLPARPAARHPDRRRQMAAADAGIDRLLAMGPPDCWCGPGLSV